MPLSISYVFTSGTVIEASEMNSNFTGVKNFVDGLATGTNIDAGAITAAKIATGAVETTKIADGAVTAQKLAPGVGGGNGDSDQIVLGMQVFS
jgi:hypothetical protein